MSTTSMEDPLVIMLMGPSRWGDFLTALVRSAFFRLVGVEVAGGGLGAAARPLRVTTPDLLGVGGEVAGVL